MPHFYKTPNKQKISAQGKAHGKGAISPLRAIFVCACLLLMAVFAALPVKQSYAKERPRVGISMPSFRESRWQYDFQALQAQADRLGIDILIRFAGNDQKQQNIQVKELVNIGIDVLLVAPTDAYSASEGIDFAKKRQVPVVAYDRLAENCDVDAYVTFEQQRVGELMGEYLSKVAPKGNYVLIHGEQSDSNVKAFTKGAMKYLAPLIQKGDIKVIEEGVAEGWHVKPAVMILEKALKKEPNITAVYAPNDDTAGGIAEVLAAHNLTGKVPVTGQDANVSALRRIQEGKQSMTVFKNSNLLAQRALQVALALHKKEKIPTDEVTNNGKQDVPTYTIPVIFVDKNSLGWMLRAVEYY